MRLFQNFVAISFYLLTCVTSIEAYALEFSDIATEGEVKFLKERPDPGAYAFQSRVKITAASLDTGTVDIATCHLQLDPIRKVVIVFNPERVQAIVVKSLNRVASAEIKANEVTLTDVERGATVCIDLRSRALDEVSTGMYRLNAGPLMRRYFDGYLPMAAQLRVDWPKDMFTVAGTVPEQKEGVLLVEGNDGMQLDMVFAGKMTAQIMLKKMN